MPKTGENIYKRKDGRWEGRYVKGHKPTGKPLYGYVYAYSYREVKRKLNQAMSGETSTPSRGDLSLNFSGLANLWLKNQKANVKESTYNKYRNLLQLYILPDIGAIPIQELSPAHIEHLRDTLLTSGGQLGTGLSVKTVADTISVIRSILQHSINSGYSCSFDMRGIRVRQQPHELRTLSPKDQMLLYNYLSKDPSAPHLGILICLLTGLRIGEVCALRWEDISFADHTIYVHQTAQRIQDDTLPDKKTKVVITPPKSISGKRVIPMPHNLETILENMVSAKSGYVISDDGMRLTEPRILQYHFKKILKELEIEDANFHILRHTFATRCVELGFDAKSLSEILGHSSVSITMNRYVHPSMALKYENMQRLSSVFAVK